MPDLHSYKKSIWALMLTTGMSPVLDEYRGYHSVEIGYSRSVGNLLSPYGGDIPDMGAQRRCAAAIREHGVNWDSTTDPFQDWFTEWGGTFGDDTRVQIMSGWLYTNNGQRWPWISRNNDMDSVMQLIRALVDVDDDTAFDRAVNLVEQRQR